MNFRSLLASFAFSAISMVPMTSKAEIYLETYNGATCNPYPAFNTTNGAPYRSWLYGFRESAFCHFVVPNTWSVEDLSYVLFEGMTQSNDMRVRLCAYYRLTYICGAEKTISGSSGIDWVALPTSLPSFLTGAYLQVNFPNEVSAFLNYQPVWIRSSSSLSSTVTLSAQVLLAQRLQADRVYLDWERSLRDAYLSEGRSEAWATLMESRLTGALRTQNVPGGLVKNIECRQQRCRVQTAILEGPEVQDRLTSLGRWVASEPACSYTVLGDRVKGGVGAAEVFLTCGEK